MIVGSSMSQNLNEFGGIHFSGTLRPSQVAAVSVIEPELDLDGKHLHIVAPPIFKIKIFFSATL